MLVQYYFSASTFDDFSERLGARNHLRCTIERESLHMQVATWYNIHYTHILVTAFHFELSLMMQEY